MFSMCFKKAEDDMEARVTEICKAVFQKLIDERKEVKVEEVKVEEVKVD